MDTIKKLLDLIDDELEDAMTYAEKAVKCKATHPEMAEMFFSLSLDELKHKGMLQNHLQRAVKECAEKYPEKAEAVQTLYDFEMDRNISWENSIRQYQAMYRE